MKSSKMKALRSGEPLLRKSARTWSTSRNRASYGVPMNA
jgi:hypothetical protein